MIIMEDLTIGTDELLSPHSPYEPIVPVISPPSSTPLVSLATPLVPLATPLVPLNTPLVPLTAPVPLPEEPPTVHLLMHNNHPLYCIKRQSQFYFLQKHLGQAFYNSVSTFNSTCWTHKVEKVSATSAELKLVRDSHPTLEQGLKKATMISFETLKSLCETIKKPDMYTTLKELLDNLDDSSLLTPDPNPTKKLGATSSPALGMTSDSNLFFTGFDLSGKPPAVQPTLPPAEPPAARTSPPAVQAPLPPAARAPAVRTPAVRATLPPSVRATSPPAVQATLPPAVRATSPPAVQATMPPAVQPTQPPPPSFVVKQPPGIAPPVLTTSAATNKQSKGKTCKKKYSLNESQHSPTLASQLTQLERYWVQPNNLLRKEPAVNGVTHKKRRERILCFMGWCQEFHQVPHSDLTMYDVSKPENRERYELYLDYLKNDRKLGAGTMVEHFTAAVYALKFLFASQTNTKYSDIPAIAQLRALRNEYQREYERGLKSQNWVELREDDRFLHYEEVQQVLKVFMDEFLEGQKDLKAVKATTVIPLVQKAKQLQKFLVLLFYTSLPPSRALEMRTLQHGTSLQFKKATNTWWLILTEFKTIKSKGVDSVELDPNSQQVLVAYLELFLRDYRPCLLEHWWAKKMKLNPMVRQEHVVDEKYLFVPPGTTKNQGYTESAWSSMVCQLFKEKTGMSISINALRSSFITYFYDSEASQNLNLRESIANGMRHSVNEAQKTYDRRTGFEKKRKAVDWCGINTMKCLQGEDQGALPPPPKDIKRGPTSEKKYDNNEPHCHPPNQGDVVAVPFQDSENDEPSFWLGKCLRVNTEDSTLLLGWFEEVGENQYKMKIGASWSENVKACIFPIDVKYNDENHTYTLLTPTKDILSTM